MRFTRDMKPIYLQISTNGKLFAIGKSKGPNTSASSSFQEMLSFSSMQKLMVIYAMMSARPQGLVTLSMCESTKEWIQTTYWQLITCSKLSIITKITQKLLQTREAIFFGRIRKKAGATPKLSDLDIWRRGFCWPWFLRRSLARNRNQVKIKNSF